VQVRGGVLLDHKMERSPASGAALGFRGFVKTTFLFIADKTHETIFE
jgi:hypothetical protein